MLSQRLTKKLVSTLAIGICDCLREGTISIRDAEILLFSPAAMRVLASDSPDLWKIILEGTELDDIADLVPDKLDDAIDAIRIKAQAILRECEPEVEPAHWFEMLS